MNRQRQTFWVSIAGALAVAAYAGLAALQILVLNPLAAAPGLTLDEIQAEMSAAGEALGGLGVLFILGVGIVMAAIAAVASIANKMHPVPTAMLFLALLMAGAPVYFVASFGSGMALADTFMISGGDASPWALPLYAVSVLSAAAIIVGVIVVARSGRPAAAAV